MRYSQIYKEELEKGDKGDNQGIPHRFERLRNYIPSIQKGTYYLICGESGSGKTSFATDVFIESVLEWYLENKDKTDIIPDINFFSFEIKIKDVLAKLAARKIYKEHKILLDINLIYQRGFINSVPDEIRKLCKDAIGYFDEIQDLLTIYNNSMNPTGIHMLVNKKALYYGKETRNEGIVTYQNNKPNVHVSWITDHLGKIKKEHTKDVYLDDKGSIDKYSQYCVDDKNLYDHTFINLQQINREIATTQRQASLNSKIDRSKIRLQNNDLKGTGNPVEDCDFNIGIFSPFKYEIEDYDGYKIIGSDNELPLRNRFRSLQILKGRDGDSDVNCPAFYLGEIGRFYELPKNPDFNVYKQANDKKKYNNSEYIKMLEGKQNSLF